MTGNFMQQAPKADHMLVGYARISAIETNLDLQIETLIAAGVAKRHIHVDRMTRRSSDRPGLRAAVGALKPHDTLVVASLDRLGASLRGVLTTVEILHRRQAHLVVLNEDFDTRRPGEQAVFRLLKTLARIDVDLAYRNARLGLAAARQAGVAIGQRPVMTPQNAALACKMLFPSDGSAPATKEATAAKLGVSRTTLYNWLRAERAESVAGDPFIDH